MYDRKKLIRTKPNNNTGILIYNTLTEQRVTENDKQFLRTFIQRETQIIRLSRQLICLKKGRIIIVLTKIIT